MASADFEDMSGSGCGLHIYADGCYEPESQTGGWAFVVYRDGFEVTSGFGRVERSSNNGMELSALLAAATWVNDNAAGEAAILWSDSVYAVSGCNRWRHIWKNSGWRKRDPGSNARSRTIANPELWQAVDAALSKNSLLTVAWCKGHSGIPGNEKADGLAELGRRS
ncbi:ribonuclease HI [Rhizobium sp. TH2]|uniref:ribonuclease H family protein n=1 Tax=Rhizobium sp. TH2 TaxID=2775403 RepID=UPI002157C1F4|nr:ribonuclease H [Rhizobium sp. TH2]UVC11063.1 ribonuclease HI [Rhizobium sp. TH2]